MKDSANSNIYSYPIRQAWEVFAGHLEGAEEGLVCVVGSAALSADAKRALEASAERLGYGIGACTWVTLDVPGVAGSGAAASLTPAQLFSLIEGLDPLALVAADSAAAAALAAAYRAPVLAPGAKARLLGRPCAVFRDFSAEAADPQTKQRAWATLKQLAR